MKLCIVTASILVDSHLVQLCDAKGQTAHHGRGASIRQRRGSSSNGVAYVDACRTSSALGIVRRDVGLLWRTLVVMAKGEGLKF